jgi:hypothetical protein
MKYIMQKFQSGIVPALVVLSIIMFSFAPEVGGDSYKVYVNDKLVLQERIVTPATAVILPLDPHGINDRVRVYFSHCGKIGTARSLSIYNAENKVLKEWHYPNTDDQAQSGMACLAKDIVSLANKNKSAVYLYYSSEEIPGGIQLATIQTPEGKHTALH